MLTTSRSIVLHIRNCSLARRRYLLHDNTLLAVYLLRIESDIVCAWEIFLWCNTIFFIIHKLLLLSLTENYHLPSCQLKYNLIISIINLQKRFHSFQEIKIYKNWSKTQTYLWTEMVFFSLAGYPTPQAVQCIEQRLWTSLLMTVCLFVCLLLTLIFKSARIPWTTSKQFPCSINGRFFLPTNTPKTFGFEYLFKFIIKTIFVYF